MVKAGVSVFIAILAVEAVPIGAQQPQQFRAGVDVIQLDVSVIDKQRHPVTGLTAADFTVLEDGKPQAISVFKEISIAATPAPVVPNRGRGGPAALSDSSGRLIAIILDDAQVPFQPQMVSSVKDIASRVVDSMGPSDLASVVFTRAVQRSRAFTNDRAILHRAIDGFTGITSGGDLGAIQMMHTLGDTAAQLGDVTSWKKLAILVSVGAPVDPSDRNPNRARLQSQFTEMTSAIDQARRANVTFYSIDPGGLGGLENYLLDLYRRRNLPDPAGQSHKQATLSSDFLHVVSTNTGGDVVAGTNDFAPGIAKIFEQTSVFYVIGYTTTNSKADGKFRKIQVKVNRKDVEVRTRDGYNAPK